MGAGVGIIYTRRCVEIPAFLLLVVISCSYAILDIPVKPIAVYCNARIRHNGVPDKSTKQRTKVVRNSSFPVWEDEMQFRIRDVTVDTISFHIYVRLSYHLEVNAKLLF